MSVPGVVGLSHSQVWVSGTCTVHGKMVADLVAVDAREPLSALPHDLRSNDACGDIESACSSIDCDAALARGLEVSHRQQRYQACEGDGR